jgi:hypothetical protein
VLLPDPALALDLDVERSRERVDDGEADAMEAARDLVRVVVELASRVEVREDDFQGLAAVHRMRPDGDTAPVVLDGDGIVGVDDDGDRIAVPRLRLVDRVVDELRDHVVKPRDVVGVPDVHPGPLAHGLQPLQELDRANAIVFRAGVYRPGRQQRLGGDRCLAAFAHLGPAPPTATARRSAGGPESRERSRAVRNTAGRLRAAVSRVTRLPSRYCSRAPPA